MRSDDPLIVQPDRSLMLHTVCNVVDSEGNVCKDDQGRPLTEEHPRYQEARDRLAVFAELAKSPDYLHTYQLNTISVWNAAALGVTAEEMLATLEDLSCVPIPPNIEQEITEWVSCYGVLRIERREVGFELISTDPALVADVLAHESVRSHCSLGAKGEVFLDDLQRGLIKQALIRIGFPVDDRGGYLDGDPLDIKLRQTCLSGEPFVLRDYQKGAAQAFHAGGTELGGSGVVVLPCGAGKTVTGMAVMELVGAKTLILTTNTVAVRQWREELLDKTELTSDQVGEYTGDEKVIKPVTITTYQMLTWRRSKTSAFEHFEVFSSENWGLVIYDEVHLLPAPIFRVTADLQARRRLGLTATLIREDGKEDEVFCLIGPKRYDVPWKVLESKGFIASASCVEVRVPLDKAIRTTYLGAGARARFRVASENPAKGEVVQNLISRHPKGRILIIGQYIEQLEHLARTLGAPLITGKTPNADRETLYEAFRTGRERLLIVSKVGNFAIDLPDANVAIQISGTFGSRQEEAQRLGRILRPKSDGSRAVFYSVVTAGTRDQEFAEKRQLFLTEQGYTYKITEAASMRALDEGVCS
jgi:DNA excision repair protein ERCC-3